MILNCPSCGTRFLIDPALMGEQGRQVRCGSCGHSWREKPPAQEGESAPIKPLQEFDLARRRSSKTSKPEPKRRLPPLAAGWAALALLVGALAAGAWFGREQIVAQVPEAAKLYALVGLDATAEPKIGEGLDLRDVTSVKRLVDGQLTLLIEGAVVNVSDSSRPVPALRAILTDGEGVEVANWTFAPEGADLPPGGSTTFQTSTQDPPSEGDLNLMFVERAP
ncbi:MAG: zinc-ribbon domain-containing protein [Kiloniellales bacterium]|nr:zinc-ribbon domain-containing protein [Kiloniellales bacterium]